MKTKNYIIISILSSLAYYFGYQKDVLIFQILAWLVLVTVFAVNIFGFIALSMLDSKSNLQKVKVSLPTKIQAVVSALFIALNSWIFYGNQVFYFYVFNTIMSVIFLYKTYQKLKENNYFK